MKDDKIYVVIGACGEYSDHREWYVRAFACRVKAERFTEAVSAEYRTLKQRYPEEDWDLLKGNPLDPDMQSDYTGTNYYMVEVPFDAEKENVA